MIFKERICQGMTFFETAQHADGDSKSAIVVNDMALNKKRRRLNLVAVIFYLFNTTLASLILYLFEKVIAFIVN